MAATEIVMPLLGETVDEATIIQWLKKPGESVKRGDALLEAETDKITVEVPALKSGVLLEIVAPAGETVKVGEVIARFEGDGAAATPTLGAAPTETAAPFAHGARTERGTRAHAGARTGKVRASPAARRLARELGVDLTALPDAGSGPKGRITKADVAALEERAAAPAATPATASPVAAPEPPVGAEASAAALPTYADALTERGGTQYRFTRIERISARLTQKSFEEIPHFYVTLRCEVTEVRRALRDRPEAERVSLNDALVKATALALARHPRLNATLVADGLELHQSVNIGVITATDEGVVTSVVPDAANRSLSQIHARVKEVRHRLSSGRAQASDVSGATFCVSNMGMFGVDSFSAIILPPNVAILAAGAVREEVLVRNGSMRVAETMALTVSADHRALDGVAVAHFLTEIQGLWAEPGSWIGG